MLVVVVSVWDYNDYAILPDVPPRTYRDVFEGCVASLPELCLTFKTSLSTLKFCLLVWLSIPLEWLFLLLDPLLYASTILVKPKRWK